MNDDFPSIMPGGDVDWDAVDNLFGTIATEELDVNSLIQGVEAAGGEVKSLLRVDDHCGYDDILLLPNGNVLFPDRNSGYAIMTSEPPADLDAFMETLIELMSE